MTLVLARTIAPDGRVFLFGLEPPLRVENACVEDARRAMVTAPPGGVLVIEPLTGAAEDAMAAGLMRELEWDATPS